MPGLRGRWESDDTFFLEEVWRGELGKMQFRLTFAGDQVTLTAQDAVFGGGPLQAQGAWE